MSKKNVFGVDDGHANIKIFDGLNYAVIPSRVRSGRVIDGAGVYSTKGSIYTVGRYLSNPIDTRSQDYPYSDANRVLVSAALTDFGAEGDIVIETGLPVAKYFDCLSGALNRDAIKRKIDSLMLPVHRFADDQLHDLNFRIVKNSVSPEATGAYFDLCVDVDGSTTDFGVLAAKGSVAIIDIGGRTTDFARFNADNSLDFEASGTLIDVGILSLLERVSAMISRKLEVESPKPELVNSALIGGSIVCAGEKIDLSKEVKQLKEDFCELLFTTAKTFTRDIRLCEAVGFVGGGAYIIKDELAARLGVSAIAVSVDKPEFSNARGFWKIAKYQRGN